MFPIRERPADVTQDAVEATAVREASGVIGDSLSSVEFEGTGAMGEKTYHDMLDYSRGQFHARLCGNTVCHFSRGGMTAREYMKGWAKDMGYFNRVLACEAYVVASYIDYIIRHNMDDFKQAGFIGTAFKTHKYSVFDKNSLYFFSFSKNNVKLTDIKSKTCPLPYGRVRQ